MQNINHPFIKIAAVCAILAPAVMLIADLLLITAGLMFEFSLVLWFAFVLFVPAIIGLTFVLYSGGSRLALVGGISAFIGAMAGASMQTLFRVHAVLLESGAQQTVEMLRGTIKLVVSTQSVGIFFPIGLIILAVCLYRNGSFNPVVPFVLAVGAILFPIGRIGGFAIAVLSSGILLMIAFGLIGWQILNQKEIQGQSFEEKFAEIS